MKDKKNIVKILGILLTLFIFSFSILGKEKEAFDIKVTYGLDNQYYKYGKYMPVKIEITNNGKDFEGFVQVKVDVDYDKVIGYEKNLVLAKDTAKAVEIPVIIERDISKFHINVLDSKNRIVFSKEIPFKGNDATMKQITGVFSEAYSSVYYLPGIRVRLNETSFPEELASLDMLDVILVNNYDSSKLSNSQIEQIKSWVQKGGILIIGTGPNYTKTLANFKFGEDFISGSIGSSYQAKLDNYDELLLDAVALSIPNSTQIFDKSSLVQGIRYGSGQVVITEFDLGLEPFYSYGNNSEIASMIYEKLALTNYDNNFFDRIHNMATWELSRLGGVNVGVETPQAKDYMIILIIYILLGGPVMYVILKRLDKRTYMWLGLMLLSIIFTGIIYTAGGRTRLSQPLFNVLSLFEVDSSGRAQEVTYTNLITPYKKDLQLNVNKKYQIYNKFNDGNYYYSFENQNKMPEITYNYQGASIAVKYDNMPAFSSRSMILMGDNQLGEGYTAVFNQQDQLMEGNFINNLGVHLKDTILVNNNILSYIGDVRNAEEVTISKEINRYGIYDVYNMISTFSEVDLSDEKNDFGMRLVSWFIQSNLNLDAYMIGIVDEEEVNLIPSIESQDVIRNETKLVILPVEMTYITGNQDVYIPYGILRPSNLDQRSGIEEYIYEDVILTYQISKNIQVENLSFSSDYATLYHYRKFDGNIYLLNLTTGQYDDVTDISHGIVEEVLEQYLSTDNLLTVKYSLGNSNQNTDKEPTNIPELSIKGRLK